MTRDIFIIIAHARDGTIAKGGDVPWKISNDLKRFKRLTTGRPMIMGRKTFDALPGLLPGRTPLPLDVLGLFEPWRIEWPTAANPTVGDAVLQFSSRVYMAQTLKGGHFPLWSPSIMAGHPQVGDTHSSPLVCTR